MALFFKNSEGFRKTLQMLGLQKLNDFIAFVVTAGSVVVVDSLCVFLVSRAQAWQIASESCSH